MAAVAAVAAVARGDGWGPLRDRRFRLLLTARATSLLGTAMAPVGLAFAVLAATGDPGDLGLALAARALPVVLLLLVGGAVGDRLRRDRVLVVGDGVCGLAQAGTAALALTHSITLLPLVALQVTSGTATAFLHPAFTAVVPETVAAEHRQRGNALLGLTRQGAILVGAPLGGVLAAVWSPGWVLAADALSYLVSAAVWSRLRLAPVAVGRGTSLLGDIREGWRVFSSRTWLWAVVLQFSVLVGTAEAAFLVLTPVVARDSLGGPAAFGLLLAVESAGAVLAGLVALRVRPRRPLFVGTLGMLGIVPELLALAAGGPLWALAVLALLTGAGLGLFSVFWDTALQDHVPPEALSRVAAFDLAGSQVLLPLGLALMGTLASVIGVSGALVVGAAGALLPTVAVLCVRDVRALSGGPVAAPPATAPLGRAAATT